MTCLSGQILCNGQCIDPDTDNRYCGAKDNCSGANAGKKCASGQVCSGGSCDVTCVSGQILCNGQCVDPKTDNRYCGAKDNCSGANAGSKCKDGEVCSAGKCGTSCLSSQVLCGGKCIVPETDNAYCGAKAGCTGATKCRDGEVCSVGKCGVTCVAGQIVCGGRCVDPSSDNSYCGAMGDCSGTNAGKSCTSGQVCSDGKCGVTCVAGQIICDGRCVDPISDNAYCGANGKCNATSGANFKGAKCAEGTKCTEGVCKISCVSGQIACDGECIDPNTNPYYCGAKENCQGSNRGTDCTKSSTNKLCAAGKCSSSCPSGQTQCAGFCINIGATNVESCTNDIIKCKVGYENCDNTVANGCEVNVYNDNVHCGGCAKACTTGIVEDSQSVQCSNGACRATSCARGYVLKNGECEVSDTLDCCGRECKNCYAEHPNMDKGYCNSTLSRCDILSCKDGYTYDSTKEKCVEVECSNNADCGNSGYCIEGKCKCDEISACSGTRPICYQKKCVECTKLEHCPSIANATQQCKENECVHRCSAGYHMDKYSKCLENSDSECGSPEIFSAVRCPEKTPKCNKYTGLCVECINADNCILPENGKRKWCNSDNKCDILCNEGYFVVSLGGQKQCIQRVPIVPEPGPLPEP